MNGYFTKYLLSCINLPKRFCRNPNPVNKSFSLHNLTQGLFVESQVTWNNYATASPWTTAGGTYNPAAWSTINIPPTNRYDTFYITNLVQGWVNGSITNNGFLIYADTCTRLIAGVDVNSRTGEICISNAVAGARYVLSVKFDSKSIENTQFIGLPPIALYRFVSRLGSVEMPGTVANVLLNPNCSGVITQSVPDKILPAAELKTTVVAYPNPYTTIINFRIDPAETAKGKLEAFDMLGRRLAIIYEGMMTANQPIQLRYTPPVSGSAIIYRFTTGNTMLHGKLIPGDIHRRE